MTLNILGAFIQADIDKQIRGKLVGQLADLLVKGNSFYSQFVTYENRTCVIYTSLNKLMYGTLQAVLLLWEKLSRSLLEKLAFTHIRTTCGL